MVWVPKYTFRNLIRDVAYEVGRCVRAFTKQVNPHTDVLQVSIFCLRNRLVQPLFLNGGGSPSVALRPPVGRAEVLILDSVFSINLAATLL